MKVLSMFKMFKKLAILTLFLVLILAGFLHTAEEKKHVNVITIDGVIGPVSSRIIVDAIKTSVKDDAEALIIELNTPGGLDESMRIIIKEVLNSDVPIIVYVSPSGSRAASAGVFITLAANVAAMAPGTNIGAAHPVSYVHGVAERVEAAPDLVGHARRHDVRVHRGHGDELGEGARAVHTDPDGVAAQVPSAGAAVAAVA